MTGPGKELESTERLWVAGGAGGLRLSVTSRSAVEILQSGAVRYFACAKNVDDPSFDGNTYEKVTSTLPISIYLSYASKL